MNNLSHVEILVLFLVPEIITTMLLGVGSVVVVVVVIAAASLARLTFKKDLMVECTFTFLAGLNHRHIIDRPWKVIFFNFFKYVCLF